MIDDAPPEILRELKVDYAVSDHANVAFYQNAIPLLREITLSNDLDRELADVTLTVTSEPPFLSPGLIRIDRIGKGEQYNVPTPDLKLDQAFLSGLTASRRAETTVSVAAAGETLASLAKELNLLPPAYWGGSRSAPELLAAFVRPSDPSVDVILRDAANKLARASRDTAFNGYQARSKNRAWEMAEAIWAAMVGYGISYVLPPASFEKQGQMVRGPSDIMERRVGTCLDLALTYAASIEQAGLNSVVVLTEGHALVGVWLVDEDFSAVASDDPQMLRKRIQLEELVLVEATAMTGTQPARFKQAVALGNAQVAPEVESQFELALDIRRARRMQIRPLDLGGNAQAPIRPDVGQGPAHELGEAPTFIDDITPEPVREDTQGDRLEMWKRRLLDLSLRNRLLNFKEGKGALRIACTDLAQLEDLLSGGKEFKLQGRSKVLTDEDARDANLFTERQKDDGKAIFIKESMERGELHVDATEHDLDGRLTELFRTSQAAFQEGGSNVLFLSAGFLKWSPAGKESTYRAPLLLIPVRLERRSVRSGFRLVLHEDEIRFNPTLVHMLRQDFHLSLLELESNLPTDGSGVDVVKIMRLVRDRVKDVPGWEVTDDLVLTTLSFTKYLMWKDLVDRTEALKRNDVVRHLIDTPKHAYEKGGDFVAVHELDRVVEPANLFMPMSADSSQTSAVAAAAQGKDFVLFGPPGTGKSQTITNIIATCLAHGKTVLFVSQKTAALEVVQRRLHDIGLGNYCLEVHSAKAQKSKVVEQLKIAWRERQTATEQDWTTANEDLKRRRDELNNVVSALHRRRENGMSAYDAFSRVIADNGRYPDIAFGWPRTRRHTPEDLDRLRQGVEAIKTALQAIGTSADHPLQGVDQTRWTPAWREDFKAAIETYQAALRRLQESAGLFGKSIGLPDTYWNQSGIVRLGKIARVLFAPEAFDAAPLLGPEPHRLLQAMNGAEEVVVEAGKLRARFTGAYDLRVLKEDIGDLLREWNEAIASNFVFRNGKKEKVRTKLKAYCTEVPAEIGPDLALLRDLKDTAKKAERFDAALTDCKFWKGIETDVSRFRSYREWQDTVSLALHNFAPHSALDVDGLRQHLFKVLTGYPHVFQEGGAARIAFDGLRDAYNGLKAAGTALAQLAGLPEDEALINDQQGWVDAHLEMTSRWASGVGQAPAWCRWREAAAAAKATGLMPLIKTIDDGLATGEELPSIFEYAFAKWWADCVANDDPIISSFLVEEHENRIQAFVRADERVAELSRQIVRARISGGVPTMTGFGSDPEWGTLAREIQRSRLPLRQLFGQIPTALTRLAPCMMMSPLSIAQYLPTDTKPFDVVVVDEASQIPVWDAIGALARGNQVIVVGDPEQLPPTNVGERGQEDEADDIVSDLPSILDEMIGANIARQHLIWHYRSRHESLIFFSNAKYYRGQLVTFPSPVTRDTAVSFVHVPDGVYERGAGRVNRREAEVLVQDVLKRVRSSPHSVGVVTFNAEQQRLIENLLDQARMADPNLEPHFDPARIREPVIVKNLENVQGDERDVILFSIAVGADQSGKVRAQISSLNRDGGHKRLNVAVTRARRELCVFSSMKPAQIDLGRTQSRGVRDLKHYLEFAERGPKAVAEAFAVTGRPTESPFEDAVKASLESKGWEVHPQVGVSFFRVDLGIVHPDEPGRYLAGVECDGAAYHSSATARDRDRLREIVLKDLGWTIRRIWSTDWWMDRNRALERIHSRLEADLQVDRDRRAAEEAALAAAAAAEAVQADLPSVILEDEASMDDAPAEASAPALPDTVIALPERAPVAPTEHEPEADRDAPVAVYARNNSPAPVKAEPTLTAYKISDPASVALPDKDRFYDPDYRKIVRAMVDHVIATEGPVFLDVVVTRIRAAHGFQRARGEIRGIIDAAIGDRFKRTEEEGEAILWPVGMEPSELIEWRGSGGRDHSEVPLAELAGLVSALTEPGMDEDELLQAMKAHLELGRLREATRERFLKAIALVRNS